LLFTDTTLLNFFLGGCMEFWVYKTPCTGHGLPINTITHSVRSVTLTYWHVNGPKFSWLHVLCVTCVTCIEIYWWHIVYLKIQKVIWFHVMFHNRKRIGTFCLPYKCEWHLNIRMDFQTSNIAYFLAWRRAGDNDSRMLIHVAWPYLMVSTSELITVITEERSCWRARGHFAAFFWKVHYVFTGCRPGPNPPIVHILIPDFVWALRRQVCACAHTHTCAYACSHSHAHTHELYIFGHFLLCVWEIVFCSTVACICFVISDLFVPACPSPFLVWWPV
jgi:hypothetical protein